MLILNRFSVVVGLAFGTVSAQAALESRSGGTMVYDTVQNITWLADFNYANTSGVDADGKMDWAKANDWANNLVYGGFNDWRLPSTNTSITSNCTSSFNPGAGFPVQYDGLSCTGSEIGHLYYVDFGAPPISTVFSGSNKANLALFSNVKASNYWTGTEYVPTPALAWSFGFQNSLQSGGASKTNEFYAMAVRPGDVAAAVPEPQTYAMLLAGLGVLVLTARRRSR